MAEDSSNIARADLVAWLHGKLGEAEKSLKCRLRSSEVWLSGDNKFWADVARAIPGGRPMSKKQRVEESERQKRIAVHCKREVEMFRAVIEALT